jgi:hypothetical protein
LKSKRVTMLNYQFQQLAAHSLNVFGREPHPLIGLWHGLATEPGRGPAGTTSPAAAIVLTGPSRRSPRDLALGRRPLDAQPPMSSNVKRTHDAVGDQQLIGGWRHGGFAATPPVAWSEFTSAPPAASNAEARASSPSDLVSAVFG